jgi:dihydrofolate reductase
MKNLIVAYDQNRGIGASGDLLWQRDLPADLRRFRDLTTGNAIIMGRKTYDSIGQPLPHRQNIVISRQPRIIEGAIVVGSLEEAYAAVDPDKEPFIIGGGEIYWLALPDADRIFATEVNATFPQATVFFPTIDLTEWFEVSRIHHPADHRNKYDFDFVIYERL